MSARRSADDQAALLAFARRALRRGHRLRALRLVADARRLGPWTMDMEGEARALEEEAFPLDVAA